MRLLERTEAFAERSSPELHSKSPGLLADVRISVRERATEGSSRFVSRVGMSAELVHAPGLNCEGVLYSHDGRCLFPGSGNTHRILKGQNRWRFI